MTTTIQMTTPLNGERQVGPATNIVLSVTSDVPLNASTLNVRINGVSAILAGAFQDVSNPFVGPVTSPTRFLTVSNAVLLRQGEAIEVQDAYATFENKIVSISNQILKLQDAVSNLTTGTVISLDRGYEGSIVETTTTDFTITIDPRADIPRNSAVLVLAEITDTAGLTQRGVFTFRTSDTLPPQLFNFPSIIENSNLSFSLIDLLQNQVVTSSINVYFDGEFVIERGVLSEDVVGNLFVRSPSEVDVFIRPKRRFLHEQSFHVDIQAADAYGNPSAFSREVLNRSIVPRIEMISLDPQEEDTINPLDPQVLIQVRVDVPVEQRFINVSYTIPGTFNEVTESDEHFLIAQGVFAEGETGSILAGRDIFIRIDNPAIIGYNQKVSIRVLFQELNEDAEPVGPAFFDRSFSYNTVSTRLGPTIDRFTPASTAVVSPTTTITFRLISFIEKDPIDTSTLSLVINNVLAIDQGSFSSGFTGSITAVQDSAGNAVSVIAQPTTAFTIGETVTVSVEIKDRAGNLSLLTQSFIIANTNIPVLSFAPAGGVYNEIIRVTIAADQEAQIFYTLDGTVPIVGALNTFVGTSPVSNIPVFSQGITQIRAIATNVALLTSPILTEIYDVNQFPPVIVIDSPINDTLQDITTVPVEYTITLDRGYLTRVEYAVNSGIKVDMQNTLSTSSFLASGLTSGTNTIEIFATDNAGNVGIGKVQVVVNPSSIDDFTLKFAPLLCPVFTSRALVTKGLFNDFIDTATVVIIGYGRRRQVLTTFAVGNGEDGKGFEFQAGADPDGRHFELNSFPVQEDSLKVLLSRKGRSIQIAERDYVLDRFSGQIVLDHPLETGEALIIDYISESDINNPELFKPTDELALFSKHGEPSVDNTLSLATRMAFENGATRVLAIQPLSLDEDFGWDETFAVLEKEECYWLVPVLQNADMGAYATIRLNALNHATKMSRIGDRKERVVVAGQIDNEENSFADARMELIHMDLNPTIRRIIAGEVVILNPSFVSATIAGKHSSFGNPSVAITNKTITGFTLSAIAKSPRLDLDKLIRRGLVPVQALAAGAKVVRGRTSSLSGDPRLEEISVQRTVDYISKNLRKNLENAFTGRSVTPDLIRAVQSAANSFLASQPSISVGQVTSIGVDIKEPRQINIAVDLTPLFPLNELVISIGVSTSF